MSRPLISILALTLLLFAGCAPATPSAPTPTPELPVSLDGHLMPWGEEDIIAGRLIALCRAEEPAPAFPAACRLLETVAVSDHEGRFHFDEIAPGTYFLLLDSGLSDFEAARERWAGRTLRPGNWDWVRDEFLMIEPGAAASVHLPDPLPADPPLDRASYGLQTLLIGDSPFILAHEIGLRGDRAVVEPVIVETRGGEAPYVEFRAISPRPPDYGAIREQIGPLDRQEIALLDRDLVARWERFLAGDEAAYRDTDRRTIEALRSGEAHRIGGASLDSIEEYEGELVKRVGYAIRDPQSGEKRVIGWLDGATGDVIEASTGYRLNVRDDTGVWIEEGPEGEQFYRYGFSYYRRWGRLLPDPVIALLEAFYTRGAAHAEAYRADYALLADTFGGDLALVDWNDDPAAQVAAYLPAPDFPPFVILPDSGTVDIRRERFLEAVINGAVVVDEDSVEAFIRSTDARNGAYDPEPYRQEVIDALLTPYRSGHLFSDLEAAIILGATYDGDGEPLRIVISPRLGQGFLVPRDGRKVIYVASSEVAGVILGYPGVLNSRWGHEMGHVVDFRSEQYTFRAAGGRVCEPVKYIMEYMWWVQRYPGDAPEWDWMPLNSGLTLSRLLNERFHNSGC